LLIKAKDRRCRTPPDLCSERQIRHIEILQDDDDNDDDDPAVVAAAAAAAADVSHILMLGCLKHMPSASMPKDWQNSGSEVVAVVGIIIIMVMKEEEKEALLYYY
jgi:hypothetical protein